MPGSNYQPAPLTDLNWYASSPLHWFSCLSGAMWRQGFLNSRWPYPATVRLTNSVKWPCNSNLCIVNNNNNNNIIKILLIIIIQLFAKLGRKISSTSGVTGKELFCSAEFRCWCNARTLSCNMTPCQALPALTDDLYQILYYLNFKLPREHIYRGYNYNDNTKFIKRHNAVRRLQRQRIRQVE